MAMEMVRIRRRPDDYDGPELTWPGRARDVLEVEKKELKVFQRWGRKERRGRIILGDNLSSLASIEPGSVNLVYLDPPFFSGQRYSYRTRTGETFFTTPSFDDQWEGKLGKYLSFLEDRLLLLKHVLAENGSLYIHLDASAVHYVKILLDEIFGISRFSRQIIWKIGWVSGFKSRVKNWIRNHDVLLYYAGEGAVFHRKLLPHPKGYTRRHGKAGEGRPVDDVWLDLPSIQLMSFSGEKTGWATQKNESLLQRIIEASSNPGDIVLDPFGGAGTTAIVAAALDRKFITIDNSPLAVHLTRRRLLEIDESFTLEGDEPLVTGLVKASVISTLAGPEVILDDVPEAEGPEGTKWHQRIDGWWIAKAKKEDEPVWYAHRSFGRKPLAPVLNSPMLSSDLFGEELVVSAVDLAGRLHSGKAVLRK